MILSKIQRKVQRKVVQISRVPSDLAYRVERFKHSRQLPVLSPADQRVVDTCRQEGVCVTSLQDLKIDSTPELPTAARRQLELMEQILPKSVAEINSSHRYSDALHPQIFTLTDLPEFFAWGSNPRLLSIVENYVGLPVAFQGVHLRRDFANTSPITTELWHLDLEDRRMLKIIVYLCNVAEENGAFEYIPKSKASPLLAHRIQSRIERAHALGIDDEAMAEVVPRSEWRQCPGPAGTVVFVDPVSIFHHGKSRLIERSTLFFVYTSAKPLHPEHCKQYSDQTFARPPQSNFQK